MTELLEKVAGEPAQRGGTHALPATFNPTMRAAAHRMHAARGAIFERRAGWLVPSLYQEESGEAEVLRTRLGVADISARGKVNLSGAVSEHLNRLTGSDVDVLRWAALSSGGQVARLARDWALALVAPSMESGLIRQLEEQPSDGVLATDFTSALSGYLAAGPKLPDFLARSVSVDPAALGAGSCVAASWAHIPTVLVFRELAAPSVEIYVDSGHGRYAWEVLLRLAELAGGAPVGWRAIEAFGWSA